MTTTKTTLIIIAHGSRRPQSNDEVRALVEQFQQLPGVNFERVDAAFLELATPSLHEAVAAAAESGSKQFLIYPYFLNTGKHVERDIPAILDELASEYSQCHFQLLEHFGSSSEVLPLIQSHVDQQI
ncbi:MAG: CbiX/SirB N-terminal domain-containing protein [Motiliproteus sp.]|nr:CbiX/SirB N-terminal domain-containing protein [Motiliproteus sp.]MCW9051193.1 CbiX/SirB N-terminal domain-containing protein [Motiliproteus sp.]